MSSVFTFLFILLFNIFNIIFCITSAEGFCNISEYSTFSMNCTKVLIPELKEVCTAEVREDGLNCINIGENQAQKNYFGVYFQGNFPQKSTFNIDSFFDFNAQNLSNCKNEHMIFCQKLMNFCILNAWNNNNYYCDFITNNNNNVLKEQLFPEQIVNDITMSYTLDGSNRSNNRKLNFWVAKYGMNGTLIKFERFEDNFLQCSNSESGKTNYKYYGNNYKSNCYIDIKKYKNKNTNYFYEIFLENNLEGSQIDLIKIPIYITNIKNENLKKTRRIFLHNYNNTSNKFYYAKKVKLYVHTRDPDHEYNIRLPYFEVTYDSLENLNSNKEIIEYTFIADYRSDISGFMKTMKAFFWTITSIVIFLALYRTFVWIQYNPREIIPDNYFFKLLFEFIYKSCKYLGTFYFWFTFSISAYWYFFYKLQTRVIYLMPPEDDESYDKFKLIFYIGFGCYMIKMFIRIYKQVSFDIFFVDWETEKNMAINDTRSSLDKTIKYKKYRSAWRMIHVANQFNQLQKKRIFHLYFGFCWIILLYFRCEWYRRELLTPDDRIIDEAPVNLVLRNFIASIIVMASVSIELVIVKLLQLWLPLKKQEFMDLCSVSNISVFILDSYLHGYYIHGFSPFLKADVNYDELFNYLNEESTGPVRSRGLENDTEEHNKNQSYEMFLSHVMRTIYDGLYIIQTESLMVKGVNKNNYFKKSKLGRRLFKNFINLEKDQTMLDNYMNNQLKNKLELISSNVMAYIKDKSFCQRIMGYTINNAGLQKIDAPDLLFYRDYGQNFDDLLFCGMEWEWFIMDLFVFQFFMIILDDNFIAMFLTYLWDSLLYYIRGYLGDANVAKKAVVDDRFLN